MDYFSKGLNFAWINFRVDLCSQMICDSFTGMARNFLHYTDEMNHFHNGRKLDLLYKQTKNTFLTAENQVADTKRTNCFHYGQHLAIWSKNNKPLSLYYGQELSLRYKNHNLLPLWTKTSSVILNWQHASIMVNNL